MSFTLVGTFEGQEIRHEVPQGVVVIGRGAEAELRLPVASVSRRHAKIQRDGDQVTVEDLGSRNGTRVNGRPVTGAQVVKAGDRIDVAGIVLLVEGLFPKSLTTYNESVNLMPQEEISWDEVRVQRQAKSDRQSRLFQILAEAGELMTIPRAPEQLYEPILDLVDTALEPERSFILLIQEGRPDPVVVASRIKGPHKGGALALSRTLVARVLNQRTSILTTDPVNDPNLDGAMSMISQSIRTAVAAPLFDNEVVIGLLYADDTRAKRITRDELRAFTMLANGIAVALSHSRYHQLEQDKQRQDAQLATASEILSRILPTDLPDLPDWDLSATLEPCFEVGGDLYDLRTLPDGRLAVVVGDVTGKGLGAALLVSQVLSLTRFMIGEGWEPAPLDETAEPGDLPDHRFRALRHGLHRHPRSGHGPRRVRQRGPQSAHRDPRRRPHRDLRHRQRSRGHDGRHRVQGLRGDAGTGRPPGHVQRRHPGDRQHRGRGVRRGPFRPSGRAAPPGLPAGRGRGRPRRPLRVSRRCRGGGRRHAGDAAAARELMMGRSSCD